MIRRSWICFILVVLLSCGTISDRERKIIERYVASKWENGNPNVVIERFDRQGREYRKKVFSPDSILVHAKEFRMDTLHGHLTRYYPSGQKRSQTQYIMGEKHGWSQGWFESGKKRFKSIFRNDTLIASQSYYENGQREAELNFKNGLLDSVAIYYTSEGAIKMKGQWKENLKTGVWEIYNDNDSKLQYYAHYTAGALIKIDTLTSREGFVQ